MPSLRNIPSMPKVRDSSGTIGTTSLPTVLSRMIVLMMRTKAMVVEISRPSLPFAFVRTGGDVRGVHFVGVVAAAIEPPYLVVRHVRDHIQQLGILAEEMLAHERAVVGLEGLVLAVHRLLHALEQYPLGVAHD